MAMQIPGPCIPMAAAPHWVVVRPEKPCTDYINHQVSLYTVTLCGPVGWGKDGKDPDQT